MTQAYSATLSKHRFGDICVEYLLVADTQEVGLRLYPVSLESQIVARREILLTHEQLLMPEALRPMRAWTMDSLVQFKLAGDAANGYSQGLTLRNSETLGTLRYAGQQTQTQAGMTEILTTLRSPRGYACRHALRYRDGDAALTLQATFCNEGAEPLTLEMLASFSLGDLTPFAPDDAPDRLYLHRFRSFWAGEGRHLCQAVEDLHLERSWASFAVRAERFGQVGSMPVRGYFPFVAVEDRAAGVFWGAQLSGAGSWQIDVYRRDDQLALSGGLADAEFGHWTKTIAPGEIFASPPAYLSTVQGDLDDLCSRLTAMQAPAAGQIPAMEETLPVIANEWCTTWGDPTHARLVALADRLQGSGVKYLVIDAGWYKGDDGVWSLGQGEWRPSRKLFPDGLAATAAAIRERGLIAGIWYEFEVVGSQSPLFESQTVHFLQRAGRPVTAGQRRFWDFRDSWVLDYLRQKVIAQLREAGLGYIKVDYNETIGLGADRAESLGEGLRQHLVGVQGFFREMRAALPELVIEVCASGGHRLEPSMLALASMGSFSDAHETLDIPIIAASLQRLILPQQSQIWAVLHAADTPQRLAYSLAAGFLGRLCLSGELDQLSEAQWGLVREAIRFYEDVAPVIKHGKTRLYQEVGRAWRHPQGRQAVVRVADDGCQALVVIHTFATPPSAEMVVPLPAGDWRVTGRFPEHTVSLAFSPNQLHIGALGEFEGLVLSLSCK